MAETEERRVSMKALETEMKHLSLNINAAIQRMDKVADLVTTNTLSIRELSSDQKNMVKDIDDLETKVNGWNALNSVGVVIASTVAAIGAWIKS